MKFDCTLRKAPELDRLLEPDYFRVRHEVPTCECDFYDLDMPSGPDLFGPPAKVAPDYVPNIWAEEVADSGYSMTRLLAQMKEGVLRTLPPMDTGYRWGGLGRIPGEPIQRVQGGPSFGGAS